MMLLLSCRGRRGRRVPRPDPPIKGGDKMVMSRVLIVDDEPRFRHIYRALLTGEGYPVLEAAHPGQAHEILKSHHVRLALLNLNMFFTRDTALREVAHFTKRRVKVIVTSIYHPEQQKRLVPNAADYFDRSQNLQELLEKVETALRAFPFRVGHMM